MIVARKLIAIERPPLSWSPSFARAAIARSLTLLSRNEPISYYAPHINDLKQSKNSSSFVEALYLCFEVLPPLFLLQET